MDVPIQITLVVGARPNFMKAAPLLRELSKQADKINAVLIHTGQHYSPKLSQLFFDELKLPEPDIYLNVGSSSHAQQTADIMVALEKIWIKASPDLVIVFGDINSTMAAAIVAAKGGIKLAHVEAGLRSFDPDMPEEINRIVTDRLSDFLFVSEQSGMDNLAREGVSDGKVFYTGNIMIDSLVYSLEACKQTTILESLSLTPGKYAVMTMHRPSNVDDTDQLRRLLSVISELSCELPMIFPCHPRTQKEMRGMVPLNEFPDSQLKIIEPVGYLEFLRLQSEAKYVLTDSGGIQEETTYLGVPCITIRKNTERPATVEIGTNVLTGPDPDKIRSEVRRVLDGNSKKGSIPKHWDGQTATRIVKHIIEIFGL